MTIEIFNKLRRDKNDYYLPQVSWYYSTVSTLNTANALLLKLRVDFKLFFLVIYDFDIFKLIW